MSSYRIASLAYPRQYWADHGDEIIATANELNDDKWSFREARQLASNGLRTRSFEATGGELRQVWIQGLAIFLLAALVPMTGTWLGFIIGFHDANFAGPTWTLALLTATSAGMAFSTRWTVMAPVGVAIAAGLALDESSLVGGLVAGAVLTAPIALLGNGRRIVSPKTLLALTVMSVAISAFDGGTAAFISPNAIGLVGLLLVRFDPRILAAGTWHALTVAAMSGWFLAFPPDDTFFPEPRGLPVMAKVLVVALPVTFIFATIVVRTARTTARP